MRTKKECKEQIGIAVSLDEKQRLLAHAARYDMSLADYCRRVLNGIIPAPKKRQRKEVMTDED